MTLRLILVRHAKSSWDNPLDGDHERVLNARGRDAALRIGHWLDAKGYIPDAALVSSARRATETWARIAPAFRRPVHLVTVGALYHASPESILALLRRRSEQTVLMVGHNPGMAAFAAIMLEAWPDHEAFARFPTCATLVADFPAPVWSDVRPGTGLAVDFVVPQSLPDTG